MAVSPVPSLINGYAGIKRPLSSSSVNTATLLTSWALASVKPTKPPHRFTANPPTQHQAGDAPLHAYRVRVFAAPGNSTGAILSSTLSTDSIMASRWARTAQTLEDIMLFLPPTPAGTPREQGYASAVPLS